MSEPTEDQIAEELRDLGVPPPADLDYNFHDFSGSDMAEAFRAGWAARRRHVIVCNWCPEPWTPDPRSHPGGQQAHIQPTPSEPVCDHSWCDCGKPTFAICRTCGHEQLVLTDGRIVRHNWDIKPWKFERCPGSGDRANPQP